MIREQYPLKNNGSDGPIRPIQIEFGLLALAICAFRRHHPLFIIQCCCDIVSALLLCWQHDDACQTFPLPSPCDILTVLDR